MADRPRIIVDPAVRWGRPHLEGTHTATVDVAGMVVAGEPVDVVADEYALTRHQVLLACWHEALNGGIRRSGWLAWATRAHPLLSDPARAAGVPDPPTTPSAPTGRVYQYCLECDTTYPTARALRRAWRQGARCAFGRGMWRERWRDYLTRASRIRACPECLHDWP